MATEPTILQSGHIQTGNSTPTGNPMMVAVDNPYVTKDEYVASFEGQGLGITTSSPQYVSGELDRKLLQASAWINRYCRRWFDTQTVDQQDTGFQVRPYNPQLVTVILKNGPYTNINSVYIQVLQWYIQVQTGPNSYLQNFFDKGFYKIVPLLSSAGTGLGTPIPAAILDHVALGVLWTNYTFGYGTPLTAKGLNQVGNSNQFQAPLGNRLWAPSQTLNVYINNVLQVTSSYTVDYPNGTVTFNSTPGAAVTADFVTNESVPFDIKEATILLASHLIGQGSANPLGAASYSIQTYSINFGAKSKVKERVEELLEAYVIRLPSIIGF
jgi:hypothetical protein